MNISRVASLVGVGALSATALVLSSSAGVGVASAASTPPPSPSTSSPSTSSPSTASPSTSSPDPSTGPTPGEPGTPGEGRRGHRHGPGGGFERLGGMPLHSETVVKLKDGTFATVVTARGEVTAVSPTSLTVRAEDGFTQVYAVTTDTKIRGDGKGKDATIADVTVGAQVLAEGKKADATVTADRVFVRQ